MPRPNWIGCSLFFLGITTGAPLASAQNLQLKIDPSQQFQTMDGFGTSLYAYSPSAPYSNANVGAARYGAFVNDYAKDLGNSMVRMEFSPDALPAMPIGGLTGNLQTDIAKLNFNADNVRIFGNAASALDSQKLDQLKLIGSIWTPPAWMKANNTNAPALQADGTYNDPNNHIKFDPTNANNLDPATLQQFSRYVAAYVKGMEQKYNVPVYGVSLQNELSFNESYNSNSYYQHYAYSATDPQFLRYAALVKAVGQEFQKDGIATKIIGPESVGPDGPITSNDATGFFTHVQMNYIAAVKADTSLDAYGKTTADYLSAYAVHSYSSDVLHPGGRLNWSDYLNRIIADNKPAWQTEGYGENPAWFSTTTDSTGTHADGALLFAQHIHEALAFGNNSAYLYWQTADGNSAQSVFTLMDSSDASLNNPGRADAPNFKYNVFKHYSRYIRPGAVRIAAGPVDLTGKSVAEDPNGINVDAYFDPANHTVTVELINMSAAAQTFDMDVSGLGVSSFNQFRTSATEPWATLADVGVLDGRASLMLPGQSVVTLFGSSSLGTTVPEPSSLLGVLPLAWFILSRRRNRA